MAEIGINSEEEKEKDNPRLNNPRAGSEYDNPIFEHFLGTAEKTNQTSSYVSKTYYKPYNPDDIWQKTGDYSIYEDMANDDQVSVCLQLKKDLIIGAGWDIVSDDEDQQEIVDDTYSRLENDPEESLDDYLDTYIDNANTFGFGLAEKRFQKRPDNSISFRSLKTRHPDSWLLHTDIYGNITKYEQYGANDSIDVDAKSLMMYTPNRSTVSPYGKSDLRKVYNAWFTKRHITRFYSIYLEKYASPIPVGKYKDNTPDAKVTEFFNIIKKFQQKTAMVIPESLMVEFLENKGGSGDIYERGINLFNMFIGRGLFIPDLLGFSGKESSSGGSQALGREQVDMFLKHIAKRRRSLERLVNRHIVQPMVIYNHGFMENYPKFQLKPITEEDTKEYAKIFIEATKGKLYKPTEEEINHLRSLIKFPEGTVEFNEAGSAGGNPFQPQNMMPNPNDPNGLSVLEPAKQKDEEVELEIDENKQLKEKDSKYSMAFKPTEGDYAEKVNFKAIEAQLESSESKTVSELKPLMNEIFEDLYQQLRKKNILGPNPKPDRLDTIKLKKLKTFQQILIKNLRQSFKDQSVIARAELFKQNFTTPIDTEEFLKLLESETFQYVGDWEYQVTKEARIAMQQAIRDGAPLSSVIDLLDESGKKSAQASIERYTRTKFTEVMNRARLAEFENSRVVDAYQYSAILDGRTSEICAGLHGKIFKKGTEPIPPMHFNCRSVLVPITIFENYVVSETAGGEIEVRDPNTRKMVTRTIKKQPIDKFIEENKGKGFSRR